MAKQDIKKQLDFLRILFYEGGAWDRAEMARRLHLQPSTYDKYLREWRQRLVQTGLAGEVEEVRRGCMRLRYRRQAAERAFLLAYGLTATKAQQRKHLLQILLILAAAGLCTQEELADALAQKGVLCAENTLKKCLGDLQREGVIWKKREGRRAAQYGLDDWLGALLAELDFRQRRRLRDFVDYAAARSAVSVSGYLLLHTLEAFDDVTEEVDSERLWYRHHPAGRLLDEYWAQPLAAAAKQRRAVWLEYYVKEERVRSRNQGGQKAATAEKMHFWPVAQVHDEHLGRRYLVGLTEEGRLAPYRPEAIRVLRMENIAWLEAAPGGMLLEEGWTEFIGQRLRQCWLVAVRDEVEIVRARFFAPPGKHDYVGERLAREKRWGCVKAEAEGVWILTLPVRGTMEVRPWLRSFGAQVEVLEPLHLREFFRREWEEVASRYAKAGTNAVVDS